MKEKRRKKIESREEISGFIALILVLIDKDGCLGMFECGRLRSITSLFQL
jgi:hypothetical protein